MYERKLTNLASYKSFIPCSYHTKKGRPEFVEHELDVDNLKADSKAGVDEVKINIPVLAGHLAGGHAQAFRIMTEKVVRKGLVDEESNEETITSCSFSPPLSQMCRLQPGTHIGT